MIVIAEGLIPLDRLIKPRGLIRLLIIDGGSADVSAGAWRDELAVEDVDIPP